jgi:hypothetical protein
MMIAARNSALVLSRFVMLQMTGRGDPEHYGRLGDYLLDNNAIYDQNIFC